MSLQKFNTDDITIRPMRKEEEPPYDLLLDADPSKEMVDRYLPVSEVYIALWDGSTVGEYVLYHVDHETVEIKNIAVKEGLQGRGIGKLLLAHAAQTAKEKGYKNLMIGTANSSHAQLYLYQKQGFEITGIKMNFFAENYPEPLYENGIRVKHMIMLCRELSF